MKKNELKKLESILAKHGAKIEKIESETIYDRMGKYVESYYHITYKNFKFCVITERSDNLNWFTASFNDLYSFMCEDKNINEEILNGIDTIINDLYSEVEKR